MLVSILVSLVDLCIDGSSDLRSKLATSTEAELMTFQMSLQTTKDATALDLQKNVFKKYVSLCLPYL